MSRLLVVVGWFAVFLSAEAQDAEGSCDDVSFLQVELEVARKEPRKASLSLSERAGSVSREQRALGPYRQVLKNVGDTHYTGRIDIGGQIVDGIYDTGSFELVAMSTRCHVCFLQGPVYNPSESESFVAGEGGLHQHMYGSGLILDKEAYDSVAVGDGRFVAADQPFWMVVGHVMPIILGADFGAIVGLGKKQTVPKWIDEDQISLLEALDPSMDRFSICFGRAPLSNGWLTWRAEPPVATATSLNVIGEIHWGLNLTNVHLDDSDPIPLGCEEGCGAVLDSGTSLIAAPSSVLNKLSKAIEMLDPECENIDALPDLVIELDGKKFALPPTSYVGVLEGVINPSLKELLAFESGPKCQPLLIRMDGPPTQYGPLWIIGMPFFREFHTTFESIREGGAKNSTDTIYTSPAGPDCEPDAGTQLYQQGARPRRRSQSLRRLDASKIKLPTWLHSFKEGSFRL